MVINHYQLLGIPADADAKQVKAAYRSMAKRFHPDANKGSEAAAELFRQLNEAYRVLSDERLRKAYDRTITLHAPTQKSAASKPKPTVKADPQQKFNRFLNSLLDAVFAAPEARPAEQAANRPDPTRTAPRKVRSKPDFNFYYYLEMERSGAPYSCGEDGIYRRNPERAKKSNQRPFR